jgi:hypothetical protein
MSKNTTAEDIILLKLRATWSVSLMHCSIVLWRAWKSNWLALSRPLSSICLWRTFRITFWNRLPVVDRRLIGRKFWGNSGYLPGFGNVVIFVSFQDYGKWDSRRQWLNKCVKRTNDRLGCFLRHSLEMCSIPQYILNFKELSNFCKSHGGILSGGLLSTASSRVWPLASTQRSWFSSHRSWCVNWFSKQSAIALAFSNGWNLRPEGLWMAVGALGPSLFRRNFAMGQKAWGGTSVLLIFVSHRWSWSWSYVTTDGSVGQSVLE